MKTRKEKARSAVCAALAAAIMLSSNVVASAVCEYDEDTGSYIYIADGDGIDECEQEESPLYCSTNLENNASDDVEFELIVEYSPKPIVWDWNNPSPDVISYTVPLTAETSYTDIMNIMNGIEFTPTDETLEMRFGVEAVKYDEWVEYQFDYCGIGHRIEDNAVPSVMLELVKENGNIVESASEIDGNENELMVKAISFQSINTDTESENKPQLSNIMLTFVVKTAEGEMKFRVGEDFDFITLGLMLIGVIDEYNVEDFEIKFCDEQYIVVKNTDYALIFERDKDGSTNSISLVANGLYVENNI